jgi:hypothetical protein
MVVPTHLPDTDHVARTCKSSTLDPDTRDPTPASFEFRLDDDHWKETYLSVNWLEYLQAGEATLKEKVEALRAFQVRNEHDLPVIRPTRKTAFAVVKTSAIHAGRIEDVGTTLACRHKPNGPFDPHSGILPHPGVAHWPVSSDAAAHLAVKQFLFQAVCHHEPGLID